MFGVDYLLAFIKLGFNIAFAVVSAIPFCICWNRLAPVYLSEYIPDLFLKFPYWHVVGIFLICTFLGEQIQKLTPKIVSISQKNDNENKNECPEPVLRRL